jgi:hypothetical protein
MGGAVAKRLLFVTLFALILLCSPLHADTGLNSSVYMWVGASILISALFIGLIYMAAKVFELQVLEAWVKIETGELFTAIVIAVFCVAFIASVDGATMFLTGGPITGYSTINAYAEGFLQNTVYADGQTLYMKLADVYFDTARAASFFYSDTFGFGFMTYGTQKTPAAGLSPLVAQVGQGMDTVANFMMLAAAQVAFLEFFAAAAVVMLPVGVFLRCFSVTRKTGALVLAAVLATSVIYPASYVISQSIYEGNAAEMRTYTSETAIPKPLGDSIGVEIVCSPEMQFVMGGGPLGMAMAILGSIPGIKNLIQNIFGGATGWFAEICPEICAAATVGAGLCLFACNQVMTIMIALTKDAFAAAIFALLQSSLNGPLEHWSDVSSNYLTPIMDYAMPATVEYSVLSLITFLIPIVITITSLRSFTTTFGGEPQLYGLTKLV